MFAVSDRKIEEMRIEMVSIRVKVATIQAKNGDALLEDEVIREH